MVCSGNKAVSLIEPPLGCDMLGPCWQHEAEWIRGDGSSTTAGGRAPPTPRGGGGGHNGRGAAPETPPGALPLDPGFKAPTGEHRRTDARTSTTLRTELDIVRFIMDTGLGVETASSHPSISCWAMFRPSLRDWPYANWVQKSGRADVPQRIVTPEAEPPRILLAVPACRRTMVVSQRHLCGARQGTMQVRKGDNR